MSSDAGIYRIVVLREEKPTKFYVGQSARIKLRRAQHFRALERGDHYNRELQDDFSRYGSASVLFEVLHRCQADKKLLADLEQFEVDAIAVELLYNIKRECVLTHLGTKQSAQSNAKRSATMKGIKRSPSAILKSSIARTGQKRSAEARQRMADAARGRRLTEQHKANISAGLRRRASTASF